MISSTFGNISSANGSGILEIEQLYIVRTRAYVKKDIHISLDFKFLTIHRRYISHSKDLCKIKYLTCVPKFLSNFFLIIIIPPPPFFPRQDDVLSVWLHTGKIVQQQYEKGRGVRIHRLGTFTLNVRNEPVFVFLDEFLSTGRLSALHQPSNETLSSSTSNRLLSFTEVNSSTNRNSSRSPVQVIVVVVLGTFLVWHPIDQTAWLYRSYFLCWQKQQQQQQ